VSIVIIIIIIIIIIVIIIIIIIIIVIISIIIIIIIIIKWTILIGCHFHWAFRTFHRAALTPRLLSPGSWDGDFMIFRLCENQRTAHCFFNYVQHANL